MGNFVISEKVGKVTKKKESQKKKVDSIDSVSLTLLFNMTICL